MSVIQTATAEAATLAQQRLATTRRQRWHQHLVRHVLMDILTASVAFSLAYVLRYILAVGGDVPGENFVDFTSYLPVSILFVALCILGYQRAGTYALPRATSLAAEGMSVIGSSAAAAWGVLLITALVRYPANSRL